MPDGLFGLYGPGLNGPFGLSRLSESFGSNGEFGPPPGKGGFLCY